MGRKSTDVIGVPQVVFGLIVPVHLAQRLEVKVVEEGGAYARGVNGSIAEQAVQGQVCPVLRRNVRVDGQDAVVDGQLGHGLAVLNAVTDHKTADSKVLFADLVQNGGNGANAGTHLTTVKTTKNSTELVLNDNLYFHAGLSWVPNNGALGDSITVVPGGGGGNQVGIVTARNTDNEKLTMATAMNVTSGDKVYLTKHFINASGGETPDMGAYDPDWYN